MKILLQIRNRSLERGLYVYLSDILQIITSLSVTTHLGTLNIFKLFFLSFHGARRNVKRRKNASLSAASGLSHTNLYTCTYSRRTLLFLLLRVAYTARITRVRARTRDLVHVHGGTLRGGTSSMTYSSARKKRYHCEVVGSPCRRRRRAIETSHPHRPSPFAIPSPPPSSSCPGTL